MLTGEMQESITVRTRAVVAALALGLVSIGWWLFGWTTEDNAALGEFTHQRWFGRVTTVSLDTDRDGRADMKSFYPWSSPHRRGTVNAICGDASTEWVEDRNFDGSWDTWGRELGPTDSGCKVELRVDTTGDGRPDWSLETTDSRKAYSEIAERRGF